tara:strand:- start:80 stop:823 length:744 start_codon:yes stop_codon:yes gene_type:complete
MNRIKDYKNLKSRIVNWISDYYYNNNLKSLVVGVSGGIDSAVVSTLCAETGLPTHVLTMPLHSKKDNTFLSDLHGQELEKKFFNVTLINVDLSNTYETLLSSIDTKFIDNDLANANTKSRLRMVTLYQVAGSIGGIVVGTGNKVEDYGVGFYTKYGDGGVDIAPIADLYKTEVWELGKHLGVNNMIINADPTDGLWDDDRKDEEQIGASYEELEEAMEYRRGSAVNILDKLYKANSHKMKPIPTFKL